MRGVLCGVTLTTALFVAACSSDAPEAQVEVASEPVPELHCTTSSSPEDLAARPSPLDSVTIDVGGMPAKLCYGRPSANGRVMVGGLDPFDAPWRMGANEPTTLHLGFAASVGGVDVEPGSYALYAIPTEGPWTIVVNGNPDRWGVPITEEVRAEDVGSFEVTPMELDEEVGTMTFTYEAGENGGAFVFAFEHRTFSIPILRR